MKIHPFSLDIRYLLSVTRIPHHALLLILIAQPGKDICETCIANTNGRGSFAHRLDRAQGRMIWNWRAVEVAVHALMQDMLSVVEIDR